MADKEISKLKESLKKRDEEIAQLKEQCAKLTDQVNQVLESTKKHIQSLQKLYHQIVPKKLPQLKNCQLSFKFEPGSIFSSVYYDFLKIDERKTAVFLSNASNAELSARIIKYLTECLNQKESLKEPHVFTQKIISNLKKDLKEYESTDMFYGVFDSEKMSLNYTCLGGISVLCQKKDQLFFLESEKTNFSSKNQEEIKNRLNSIESEDYFIMLTENLEELKDKNGKKFPLKQLEDSLKKDADSVHTVKNLILFHLKDFLGHHHKDLAVLVLKLQKSSLKLVHFPSIQK